LSKMKETSVVSSSKRAKRKVPETPELFDSAQ
jgi:hypothetical protein